jgi:hypothetical protein
MRKQKPVMKQIKEVTVKKKPSPKKQSMKKGCQ